MNLGTKLNLFTPPPLDKNWELSGYKKIKVLGLKEMQMDSDVLNLANVYVRVLFHPPKNDF